LLQLGAGLLIGGRPRGTLGRSQTLWLHGRSWAARRGDDGPPLDQERPGRKSTIPACRFRAHHTGNSAQVTLTPYGTREWNQVNRDLRQQGTAGLGMAGPNCTIFLPGLSRGPAAKRPPSDWMAPIRAVDISGGYYGSFFHESGGVPNGRDPAGCRFSERVGNPKILDKNPCARRRA